MKRVPYEVMVNEFERVLTKYVLSQRMQRLLQSCLHRILWLVYILMD